MCNRRPVGYARTSADNVISKRLGVAGEQIDAANRQVMGLDVEMKGTLRLTSTDRLAHGGLMPLLARIREMHPGVQVQLAMNNSFLSLTRREADVAVRGSNRPPENLVGRHLRDMRTALY